MAKKTTSEAEVKGSESELFTAPKVVLHLDRDLNDPRNVPPAGKLPSLNDEDQQ